MNSFLVIFKNNLPYDDFVAIPISSKIKNMHSDEMIISNDDLLMGMLPKKSKLMIRKSFVVSKKVVLKRYGTLNKDAYHKYHKAFCNYFGCNDINN